MSSGLQGVPSRPTCRSSNRRAFTWRSISKRRHYSVFLCRMCSSLGPTRCANEAPRVHHASRRRGGRGVAARGAGAAAGSGPADRRADGLCRERHERTGLVPGVPEGTAEAWVDGGSQHPDRHSLGKTRRLVVNVTPREGTRRATAQCHSFEHHTHHDRTASTNAHDPHCFCNRCRPDRQRLRRKLSAPWRQRHRFTFTEPTMAGKWLELLKEIAPRVVRVAMLFNQVSATYADYWLNPFKAAAPTFAVEAIAAPVRDSSELESVIAAQAREPNGGLIVMPDSFTDAHRVEITSLAHRYRLPAVYPFRFFT